MWYVIGVIGVIIISWFIWRLTSVGRGMRQRNERLLKAIDPLGKKLFDGDPGEATPDEVATYCQRPELRHMIYFMLQEVDQLHLFPTDCLTRKKQAETFLAQWMMHPNELQDPPEEIACVEQVDRQLHGQTATFIVLKYRMPADHWAGDEWLLGLAGPFLPDDEPYKAVGAFSRCDDLYGHVQPNILIDWYVDMLKKKGIVSDSDV